MKTLSKFMISSMLIVYSLVGFSILSPLISTLSGNPVFLTIGLTFSVLFALFLFLASRVITIQWIGIFSLIKDEEAAKTWLLLHSFFTSFVGRIYPLVAIFSSMAPIFLDASVSDFATTFMLVWIVLLFSIIGLWSLHLIVGMGYQWFCKGTALSIYSFSSFALQYLRKEERKGIVYLLRALRLLKELVTYVELELKELNDTIRTTRCLLTFQSEIPYDHLQVVAQELKSFPSMEQISRSLSTFNNDVRIQWTNSFTVRETTKRTVTGWLVIIATILSALTFFPETARSTLLEILQSIGSVENIQFLVGFFLLVVIVHISGLIDPYHLNPVEAKRFTPSEAKMG